MNQALATTALLNNQAIDHLGRCEYLNAVEKLTKSLYIVKDLMGMVRWDQNDQQWQEDAQMQDETANEVVFCAPSEKRACRSSTQSASDVGELEHDDSPHHNMSVDGPMQAVHLGLSCSSMDEETPCRNGSQPFVYDTPLQIWPEALHYREFNHELLSELSVALMFNLALCHHLRGMHAISSSSSTPKSSTDTENIFAQAVSLYELAYEVQMQENVELSVECTMAIVNNLGHIHQRLGNEGKASKCFSHLLSTLVFVQASSSSTYDDEENKMEVSSTSTEGFVRNISHLVLTQKVAAAA